MVERVVSKFFSGILAGAGKMVIKWVVDLFGGWVADYIRDSRLKKEDEARNEQAREELQDADTEQERNEAIDNISDNFSR